MAREVGLLMDQSDHLLDTIICFKYQWGNCFFISFLRFLLLWCCCNFCVFMFFASFVSYWLFLFLSYISSFAFLFICYCFVIFFCFFVCFCCCFLSLFSPSFWYSEAMAIFIAKSHRVHRKCHICNTCRKRRL